MNILGISDVTGNHSHASIALLQEGRLTFALSQERLSRRKNDPSFPFEAVQMALDYVGLRLCDIDVFACGYPVPRYYSSLFQHGTLDLPLAVGGLLSRRPTAARYFAPNIKKGVVDPRRRNGLFEMGAPPDKFEFVDHHLAHVVAGYYAAGFDEALAISYGGFAPHIDGRNVAGAVYRCEGNRIELLEDIPLFASGCCWSAITIALGFRYMEQEGKIMGLAAGAEAGDCLEELRPLISRFEGGRWIKYPYWIDYLMSPRREAFSATVTGRRFLQLIEDYSPRQFAAAAQQIWEESVVAFVRSLLKRHRCRRLVLAGGIFANVRINALLASLTEAEAVFVHPHPGDGSTAIGAAAQVSRRNGRLELQLGDTGLGVEFSDRQIESALQRFADQIIVEKLADPTVYAAERLAEGEIIAWFQGREEYGPRALGHRCILGDPRRMDLRLKITLRKGREPWIPIAPSVLEEKAGDYFDETPDPFMMRLCRVRPEKAAEVAGALHVDGSARGQAVGKTAFPPFRRLIERFYRRTGVPMVLSTSLNRHGEPIVHRPEEAVALLLHGLADKLVIGPFAVRTADTLLND